MKTQNYNKYLLGVLCKVLALSCFCLLSLGFENALSNDLGAIVQFGIICIIGSIILLPIVMIFYRPHLLGANIKLYPLRALLSILGMTTWIEAVKNFGSTQSILVNYLTPIFTIILASALKAEQLKISCLFFGLACYFIVAYALKSEIDIKSYGCMMAILSSIIWAGYEIICKWQTVSEHFLVQVFCTFLFAALFLLPFSFSSLVDLNSNQLLTFFGMSILRILNVVLLFLSIKLATLNWLVPISYIKFVLIAFWSFILFGSIPKVEHISAAIILVLLCLITSQLRKRAETK